MIVDEVEISKCDEVVHIQKNRVSQVYDGIFLGLITSLQPIKRNEMRKIAHKFFFESVKKEIEYEEIKRNSIINSVLLLDRDGNEYVLYYTFSYSDNRAVYMYSVLYDVGIDLVNPYRIIHMDLNFYALSTDNYGILAGTGYDCKTLSWCLQEAISKLQKTGLTEKYIITNTTYNKNQNEYNIIYFSILKKVMKICFCKIISFNGFCLCIVYAER